MGGDEARSSSGVCPISARFPFSGVKLEPPYYVWAWRIVEPPPRCASSSPHTW